MAVAANHRASRWAPEHGNDRTSA